MPKPYHFSARYLADWQIANNISPASGYFGTASRAKYAGTLSDLPMVPPYIYPPSSGVPATISIGGVPYTVDVVTANGEHVRAVFDSEGHPVTDFGTVFKVMKADWVNENIISSKDYINNETNRGADLQSIIENYGLLKTWETSMDAIERTGINAVVAFGTGGTSLAAGTLKSIESALKDTDFDPKVYAALVAEGQLQTAITDYQDIKTALQNIKSGQTINGEEAMQIGNWYLEAHPLDLKYTSMLSLLTNKNFQEELQNSWNVAVNQVEGYIPFSTEESTIKSLVDFQNNVDDLMESFQGGSIFSADVELAATEKPITDSSINAWASAAAMVPNSATNTTAFTSSTSASNTQSTAQNAIPSPTPTPGSTLTATPVPTPSISSSTALQTPIVANPFNAISVSSSAPSYSFTQTLIINSTGAGVTQLQVALINLGLLQSSATGYFGPLTEAAVKKYQAEHGISPTGIVGPLTRAQLNAQPPSPQNTNSVSTEVPPPTSTINCTPYWQAGSWSSCVNGEETRSVTDLNNCRITTNKPATNQACQSPISTSTPSQNSSPGSFTLTYTLACSVTSPVEPTITLNWTPAFGATSYLLYVNGSLVNVNLGSTATTYSSANLTAGQTYSYYLTALGSSGFTHSNTTFISVPANFCAAQAQTTVCTPSWSCGPWGSCIDGQQSESCVDLNHCGTATGAPEPVRLCNIESCIPNWQIGSWSPCLNGEQTRSVTDLNACGTTTNEPSTTQSCTITCTPDWSCGAWGDCVNNIQTEACTDINNCGVTTGEPSLQRSCQSPAPNPTCTPNWSCTVWGECVNGLQTETGCTDLNHCGGTDTHPPTKTCTPLIITDASGKFVTNLPNGTVGTPYSETLYAKGGSQSGYGWEVELPLPPGFTSNCENYSGSSCVISGTPTQIGLYTRWVQVADSVHDQDLQEVTITIYQ